MGESNGEVIGENVVVPNTPSSRVWLRTFLSYTLGLVCLVWVFHNYDFNDLLRRVAAMNPYWVLAAIICDVLSYLCQGLRWRLLLHSFGSISVLETTQAIYSGMFVNEVLPLKLGELLRAYLISRWSAVKLGAVATSIVIERLFDGFWVMAGFVVTMILVPLPHRLVEAGDALSVLILVLIGLLIALSLRRGSLQAFITGGRGGVRENRQKSLESIEENQKPVEWGLVRSVSGLLDRTAVELRSILYSPSSLFAFALSLLLVSLQWLAFWLVMLAYGLPLSLLSAAAVFVIVHVGSSLPSAPGSIGTYQFFTVLGLVLFGVDKTSATGFSLVVFVLLSVHIWVLGFWALRRSGLTLLGMRTELSKSLVGLKTNA
ncbi:MAG: flippase-like domain-containing protein [Pyrinomonadaceae bacterium]|nr:flippase-like domain-containing protein [Pyrinomonadaceae bacterium]